jgi:hypothetical protein
MSAASLIRLCGPAILAIDSDSMSIPDIGVSLCDSRPQPSALSHQP